MSALVAAAMAAPVALAVPVALAAPIALAVPIALAAPAAAAHPLHTTLTEITLDAAHGIVRAMVRVFADDIRLGAARHLGTKPVGDAAYGTYVASAISVTDSARAPIALRSCGTRRSGDLLWFCLEAAVPRDRLEHLSLRDTLLCELYADQVNIVQIVGGEARRSVLFTRGDGYKRITG